MYFCNGGFVMVGGSVACYLPLFVSRLCYCSKITNVLLFSYTLSFSFIWDPLTLFYMTINHFFLIVSFFVYCMYIFVTDLPWKKNSSSSWLNFSMQKYISKTNVHKWSAYFALLVVHKYLCHDYTLWANNLVDKACFTVTLANIPLLQISYCFYLHFVKNN